jgi:WD repeat-containing protein 68
MAGGVGAVGVGRWMNPYTMYAIDWCKWSPSGSGNGYGRVAVGSYAEDSHNYVRTLVAARSEEPWLIDFV